MNMRILFKDFQVLNNGSLRIHHLQVQDTGYYLCWAENLVRRNYAQIRLEVQGSLDLGLRKILLDRSLYL